MYLFSFSLHFPFHEQTEQHSAGAEALCESEREVTRMAHQDIAIVLCCTATCLEWAENLRTSLVALDGESSDDPNRGAKKPKVARGS